MFCLWVPALNTGKYIIYRYLNTTVPGLRYVHCSVLDSVAEPHHFDADPDPVLLTFHFNADPDPACPFHDPDSIFHFDADQDPHPSFQIKAQNIEKVLK
jgi:hypothetical protein